MNNIIELFSVNKYFKDKHILKDITFNVQKGEIFGLLGPSGAGKTTIIKLLTGQMKDYTGEAQILNQSLTAITYDLYAKVGVVTDNSGVFKELSCFENLKIFADIYKIPTSRVNFLLERVGLLDAKKKKASKLSKGMLQRLVIARALLNKPELLFLDEPTSGLDPKTMKEIHQLLLKEKAKGMSIFLTTHNMQEAEILCDNLALLNNGRIIEFAPPKDLIRKYHKNRQFEVAFKNGQTAVIDTLSNKNFTFSIDDILTIHSNEPNLEDIFLFLTGKELI